tara:strand:+ start:9070 stop:9819 length:750 start_codon:yes stop_codon:yes gene_type:complete
MKKDQHNIINKNFDSAAPLYNNNADLQKSIATKLAKICCKYSIPHGIWADLGSGTGLLAESLEKFNTNQNVIRIDNSPSMIRQQKATTTTLWDLNRGLPKFPDRPTLLASSFVLHWLKEPSIRLEEWFSALAPGGWLALAVPIQGSFQEWYEASLRAEVNCTAWDLPSQELLLKSVKKGKIRHNQIITSTENSNNITSLLKRMVKVGAHTSSKSSLSISQWRRIQKVWEKSNNDTVALTWLVQLLLIES